VIADPSGQTFLRAQTTPRRASCAEAPGKGQMGAVARCPRGLSNMLAFVLPTAVLNHPLHSRTQAECPVFEFAVLTLLVHTYLPWVRLWRDWVKPRSPLIGAKGSSQQNRYYSSQHFSETLQWDYKGVPRQRPRGQSPLWNCLQNSKELGCVLCLPCRLGVFEAQTLSLMTFNLPVCW
jgi:hypothetical protein